MSLSPAALEVVLCVFCLDLTIFHGVLDAAAACSQSIAWEGCETGPLLSLTVSGVEETIL